jgi:hypothetical protein
MTKELTNKRKWIAVGQVLFAILFPFCLFWISPLERFTTDMLKNIPWQPVRQFLAMGIILGGGIAALGCLPCSRQARIFILIVYAALMTPAILIAAIIHACNRGDCL